jgi:glycosyltransferase involved in cell wall biosynthesis
MKKHYHTLIIGTGCAGFNAADKLFDLGVTDIAILTEGRFMGTSRNTGSDKQTYYKLSLCGSDGDSVREMAEIYTTADVFVNASLEETMGLTTVEAMACGTPCVVSTGVSEEGNITGFVKYISLDSDYKVWCNALENTAAKRIENPKELIIKNNYDIITESEKMFNFFKG